jgi:hypothetical protein
VKRVRFGVSLGLTLALLAAACGGGSESSSAAGATGAAGPTGGSNTTGGTSSTGGSAGSNAGSGTTSGGSGGAGTAGSGGGGTGPVEPCAADESAPVPDRTLPGIWQKIEPPDTFCGNGTPYKFFVNYSTSSNNVMITFEPGGACWDYASCAGDGGLRGAANPDGISDDHMLLKWDTLPFHRRDSTNPLEDWNIVFVPYCTGDLHTGNNVVTYENPDPSGAALEFRHDGHVNVERVIEWVSETFTTIPKLLVNGCSAGGAGALTNYHFIRKGLGDAVQCSYMLDDSGPLFPSGGNSAPLHAKVRESWNLDPLIEQAVADFSGVDPEAVKADLGLINTALADKYPRDRLAIAMYRLDYNYSLYSYERFYDSPSQTEIHALWWEDIELLMELYATRDNLGYFIPYYRNDNCSHCITIPPVDSGVLTILAEPYRGSDIQEADIDIRDYLVHLVDDSQPLQSHVESVQDGEGLSEERAAECSAL